MVSLGSVLTILVGLIAYLMYKHTDIVVTLLPSYLDAYFVRMMYPRDKHNTGTTRVPMMSRVVPSIISKENLRDVFSATGFPVHVEKIMNVDQDAFLEILTAGNKGKTMRMLNYENYTIPHFSPSCALFKVGEEVAFDEYSRNHLFSNVSDNHSPLYAGFEAITDAEVINEMTGLDVTKLGDYRQNNLFTSNFEKEILSAQLHCAPIDSLTFQLIGTKTWYFVSPDDLASLHNIPMPTCFNLPMTDDELLSKIKNVHIIKQGPGDVMYFGPHWCHAVSTTAGPNVMFNMRYNAMDKLKKGPLSLLLKLIFRFWTRPFGKMPQDNKDHYPLLYDDINNYYSDCGPSETFNKMFETAKAMTL